MLVRAACVVLLLPLAFALATADAQQIDPSGAAGSTTTDTVAGVVYDSVQAKPLIDATVQMVSSTNPASVLSVQTDSTGSFRFERVPRGKYLIGVLDADLGELGLSSIQRLLDVGAESMVHVTLFVPGAIAIRTTLCGAPQRQDSSGMLLGFVRDADTEFPIGSAHIIAVWQEITIDTHGLHRARRQVAAKADSAGWFAICGVPTDGAIDIRAELGARVTSFIEVTVPVRGLLVRDLNLGRDTVALAARDSLASPLGEPVRHGTARIVGIVRDSTGKPIDGAQLTVWGAGVSGVSGTDGRFDFRSLPSGTQTLEIHYLGFEPLRLALDLVSGRTDTVGAKLTKLVQVLAGVHVFGKKHSVSRLDEFLRRQQHGLGQFVTAADIEKRHPFRVTDLFYSMPGMHVSPNSNFDYSIVSSRSSRPCYPNVYIDGSPVDGAAQSLNQYVSPRDIRAMEVYADAATVPAQYRTTDCGAVLIWTK
jgi:hypothetical protein